MENKIRVDGASNIHVFLSGPMTGIRNFNCAAFCDVHAALRLCGIDNGSIFNPAFEWLKEPVAKESHETYMRRCLNELTRQDIHGDPWYDFLVQLDGWDKSSGARLEALVAKECGITAIELKDLDLSNDTEVS